MFPYTDNRPPDAKLNITATLTGRVSFAMTGRDIPYTEIILGIEDAQLAHAQLMEALKEAKTIAGPVSSPISSP